MSSGIATYLYCAATPPYECAAMRNCSSNTAVYMGWGGWQTYTPLRGAMLAPP